MKRLPALSRIVIVAIPVFGAATLVAWIYLQLYGGGIGEAPAPAIAPAPSESHARRSEPRARTDGDAANPSVAGAMTVDQALARLQSANMAFNAPDHARVGKPVVIEAKLSTRLSQEEIKVSIEEAGTIKTATLKVSDRMVATLVGGEAFDVSPPGPQEQWISDAEPTGWTWQVTPKLVGEDQLLLLTFDALISVNGKEDKRTINTLKAHINVDVGWPETVGEWLDLIKKTGENLSWIWASLLVPLGGAAWAFVKWRRRVAASPPGAASPPDETLFSG